MRNLLEISKIPGLTDPWAGALLALLDRTEEALDDHYKDVMSLLKKLHDLGILTMFKRHIGGDVLPLRFFDSNLVLDLGSGKFISPQQADEAVNSGKTGGWIAVMKDPVFDPIDESWIPKLTIDIKKLTVGGWNLVRLSCAYNPSRLSISGEITTFRGLMPENKIQSEQVIRNALAKAFTAPGRISLT